MIGEAGSATAPRSTARSWPAVYCQRRNCVADQVDFRDVATLFALDEIGPDATARPSDIAAVLFTAGSSGTPKAVVHTHRTLGLQGPARCRRSRAWVPTTAPLMAAPLAHVSGLLNGVL